MKIRQMMEKAFTSLTCIHWLGSFYPSAHLDPYFKMMPVCSILPLINGSPMCQLFMTANDYNSARTFSEPNEMISHDMSVSQSVRQDDHHNPHDGMS